MYSLDDMGETIRYEWENDEYNQEVWELMTHIDEGLEKSLCGLRKAAEAGSTLAAICLSDILFDGCHGASRNIPEAISWARRAAQNGSIEGSFLLAEYLEKTGDFDAAQEEYAQLAERGYSPAMYRLALNYWAGKGIDRDAAKSVEYFSQAINPMFDPKLSHALDFSHAVNRGLKVSIHDRSLACNLDRDLAYAFNHHTIDELAPDFVIDLILDSRSRLIEAAPPRVATQILSP